MNPQQMNPQQQFTTGMDVYDANGDKVGTLDQPPVRNGALVVQKGFFFPHDIYVPISAISRTMSNGIYLNLTKDELNGDQYKNLPAEGAATTAAPGMRPEVAGQRPAAAAQTGQTGERTIDVPVVEEKLVADKQREKLGEVQIHKDVSTQQQSIEVPVSHEEVHVERVPVSGQDATNLPKDAFKEGTIDVPVYGEDVDVEKQARVTGEVEVEKRRVTNERRFSGDVRKEQVHVDEVDDQGRPINLDQLNQDEINRQSRGLDNQP
ncbi:MAG TPA: YsnF/AvaK domain-containing protein [Ktedonobacterales bacterium]|nr:YsnF/AvaK domain-containing protein [Ktedonobacterales bacterium]